MARNKRPENCRSCGDTALIDPDTFKPTGYCRACSAEAPKAAAKAAREAKKADRETVIVPEAPKGNGNRCIQTYRGEVWVNEDGEPI